MGKVNIVSVTIQAVIFSVLSTTLAQCIIAWRQQNVNFTARPYLTFILTAIITTPPNYLYQEWLEDSFPTLVPDSTLRKPKSGNKTEQPPTRFSKTYALIKFLCDQTVGAAVNTMMFIALAGLFKGNGLGQIPAAIHEDFWAMLFAGWRVWPFVTLLNLCVIPWEWRPVVGNTAGLCWGVYLTLVNMEA